MKNHATINNRPSDVKCRIKKMFVSILLFSNLSDADPVTTKSKIQILTFEEKKF